MTITSIPTFARHRPIGAAFSGCPGPASGCRQPDAAGQAQPAVPAGAGDVYLKLEWLNPFGSIKDRAAAYLLDGLIERGELGDRDLVEATSGNTGIALAALAALSGIGVTVTIPDGVPRRRR